MQAQPRAPPSSTVRRRTAGAAEAGGFGAAGRAGRGGCHRASSKPERPWSRPGAAGAIRRCRPESARLPCQRLLARPCGFTRVTVAAADWILLHVNVDRFEFSVSFSVTCRVAYRHASYKL